ncbi:MAG TPA: hypothetical protein VFP98_09125 [Candidatus Polarisedimenticolia bacterium]|nr:hypothetical protein [Candidatus Polarisedimenticolia bacterium]
MPRQTTILAKEIRSIRTSFSRLARSFSRIGPLLTEVTAGAPPVEEGGRRPRRKPRLTPDQRRALKLQGKYMGTMRGLKPGQRAQIKKIRVERGIKAAISAAQKMAGGA